MAFEIYRAVGCDEWEAFELLIGEKLVGHEVPIHIFPVSNIVRNSLVTSFLIALALARAWTGSWMCEVEKRRWECLLCPD